MEAASVSGPELVSIFDAGGRVLALDLASRVTQPPFNASAMDGYAIHASDVMKAPVDLRIVGASAAGHPFHGTCNPGEAVEIFTGAPVPADCDTVIIQENTHKTGNVVQVRQASALGANIRRDGGDFREGEVLLSAGQMLQTRHVMLAAAMNHAYVPVRRKPTVAILATGDELVSPGGPVRPGTIISSIPPALLTALRTWGAEPVVIEAAGDTWESLRERIASCVNADIVVTIGGASIGKHDIVQSVFEAEGASFSVLKVAMRPGKPLMFGRLRNQHVMGLPGNPVSAIICARIFLKPLVRRILGLDDLDVTQSKRLETPLKANGDRTHYMRAVATNDCVTPLGNQDSSLMRTLERANCLIVCEPGMPELSPGNLVRTLPFDF